MDITKAQFVISAPAIDKSPSDNRPEYAFIGRSNVGKSSLINMLCNKKSLAKTSSVPGKTLLINHFLINDDWYLVDLPGYGYAKRSKKERENIARMIESYVSKRQQLANLFVLIDIRHEQQRADRQFIDWLGNNQIPFAIIFTKADKLSKSRCASNAKSWMNQLKDTWEELPKYFISSSVDRTGRTEILDYIDEINKQLEK